MHSEKSKIAKIVLSVTALLLISVVAIGITFSWIEGGTTLSIRTKEVGDVFTSDVPQVGGTITLDPDTTTEINLINYDETAKYYKTLGGDFKDVYFSPASSINGKDFIFPIGTNADGNAIFRKGTTNDIGTKYISFEFDVKAADKCYLAFTEAPKFTIKKDNTTVTFDDSAFRCYFSVQEGSSEPAFKMFSTSAASRQYLSDVSGTTGPYNNFTLFSRYVNKEDTTNRKLCTFEKDATKKIKVVIWLDYFDAQLDANSNIFGGEVNIDLKLTVGQEKLKANFEVKTFDLNGNAVTTEDGGVVAPESGWFPIGKEVTSTATANNTSYRFAGWFTDPNCTTPAKKADNTDHTETDYTLKTIPSGKNAGEEVTYYAKFVEKDNLIFFVPSSNWPADNAWYAAYVWIIGTKDKDGWFVLEDEDGDGVYSGVVPTDKAYDGILFTRQNPASKTPSWDNKWDQTADLTLPIGDETLFISNDGWSGINGTWYEPLVVTALPDENGTTTANGADLSAVSYNGGSVKLVATPNDGYKFSGWYSDSNYSTLVNSNATYTVEKPTASVTYYAKFDKIPVLTVNTVVTPDTSFGTATVNGSETASVLTDSTVNLVATPTDGYKFIGWYTKSDYSQNIGGTFNSKTTTYKVTGTDGEVVNIYAKFEKIPGVTVKTSVIPSSCGTATVNGVTSVSNIEEGTTVNLEATNNVSGYTFEGWYLKSDLSDKIGTNYATSSTTYTINNVTDGETVIIYANFVKTYKATAHAVTNGTNNSSTGGTVKVTGKSASASVENTYGAGSSVTFTASLTSGYTFRGWFTSLSGGSPIDDSLSFTYTINSLSSDIELYARFERVLYLKPNSNWLKDGARFAAYVWSDTESAKWYSMSDGDGDGTYSVTIDPKYTKVIFCRMNGGNSTNNWDNKWNQTGDLTIPTNGNNLFTVPSGAWDGSTTSWSKKS